MKRDLDIPEDWIEDLRVELVAEGWESASVVLGLNPSDGEREKARAAVRAELRRALEAQLPKLLRRLTEETDQ